jgi:tRNA C32,U32 (ribose-2'-O)-methylase TrmJ
VKPQVYGKNAPRMGKTPAIAMVNPRCGHNVGSAVRAASCFGVKQVWFTGDRLKLAEKKRLPREERMKGFNDVDLIQFDNFFDQFENYTPVAVELRPNAESLATFELAHCHRFVVIPTRHCVNLSAAVYLILYDRLLKENPNVTIYDTLAENRRDFSNFSYEDLGLSEARG